MHFVASLNLLFDDNSTAERIFIVPHATSLPDAVGWMQDVYTPGSKWSCAESNFTVQSFKVREVMPWL